MANAKALARYFGGHVIVDNCLAAAEEEIAFNAGRVEDALAVAEQAVTNCQSSPKGYQQSSAKGYQQK